MDFAIALLVLTITFAKIQGKSIDPGRQVLNNLSHLPPQPGQDGVPTKEIILYLTPSQIRAYEAGQGFINPQQVPNADSDKHTQAHIHTNPQIFPPNENGHIHPHLAHPEPPKSPPIQEPESDHFVPITSPPEYRQPESLAYNTFQSQNQKPVPKAVPFFSDQNREGPKNNIKPLPVLPPQEPFRGKSRDQNHQQLKEQWLHLLNQNVAHFKELEALSLNQKERSNENNININNFPQNYHRYNDHKYASDVYKLVRTNNEHQIEKQQALLRAEAIAHSPPIVVHKHINLKHSPTHLIAHVPITTPVLIPILEPF